jgi:hypothetical protein
MQRAALSVKAQRLASCKIRQVLILFLSGLQRFFSPPASSAPRLPGSPFCVNTINRRGGLRGLVPENFWEL